MNVVWQISDDEVRNAWAAWTGPKRGSVRAVANQLGVPRDWLSRRLSRLGLAIPHSKEPNWSAAEDALLPTLPLHNPARAAKVMREHGYLRTATAIVIRAQRLKLGRRDRHATYSAHEATELLGLDAKTIGQYCESGRIVASRLDDARTVEQGGHRWCITPDALRDFIRADLGAVDFRRVDKFAFFALIDQPAPARPEPPKRDPVKGWTPEKRKQAYRRFGQIIIQVADELNVPANELLAYALKGEVPPQGRDQGFEDTKVPGQLALPAPAFPKTKSKVAAVAKPPRRKPADKRVVLRHNWSDAELEQLRNLAGKTPVKEIAAAIGVSVGAVYSKANEHKISLGGAPNDRGHVMWTQPRQDELRRLAGTMPSDEIGKLLGLSEDAIIKAGSRFKISLRFHRAAPAPVAKDNPGRAAFWTGERIMELRRLAEVERKSAADIAKIMGKSRNSVIGACVRAGVKLPGGARKPAPKAPSKPRTLAERITSPGTRRPVPAAAPRRNPRAPTIAPVSSKWVRLQHPDGRWLRMDGLAWVSEKANSYVALRVKLPAVLAAFPLAAECRFVDEPTWHARDIEFLGAVR